MAQTKLNSDQAGLTNHHVVRRLRRRLNEARAIGFRVRMEVLDDEQPSWCVVRGVPLLFVDLSAGAAEQLRQVDETLQSYAADQRQRAAA